MLYENSAECIFQIKQKIGCVCWHSTRVIFVSSPCHKCHTQRYTKPQNVHTLAPNFQMCSRKSCSISSNSRKLRASIFVPIQRHRVLTHEPHMRYVSCSAWMHAPVWISSQMKDGNCQCEWIFVHFETRLYQDWSIIRTLLRFFSPVYFHRFV